MIRLAMKTDLYSYDDDDGDENVYEWFDEGGLCFEKHYYCQM
jgi:hypothetical protein